jgi:hypothetical protein
MQKAINTFAPVSCISRAKRFARRSAGWLKAEKRQAHKRHRAAWKRVLDGDLDPIMVCPRRLTSHDVS